MIIYLYNAQEMTREQEHTNYVIFHLNYLLDIREAWLVTIMIEDQVSARYIQSTEKNTEAEKDMRLGD